MACISVFVLKAALFICLTPVRLLLVPEICSVSFPSSSKRIKVCQSGLSRHGQTVGLRPPEYPFCWKEGHVAQAQGNASGSRLGCIFLPDDEAHNQWADRTIAVAQLLDWSVLPRAPAEHVLPFETEAFLVGKTSATAQGL